MRLLLAALVAFGPVRRCRPFVRWAANEDAAEDIVKRRATLEASYAAGLSELAEWCDERQLADAARQLKTWLPPREPGTLTLFFLSVPPAPVKSDAAGEEAGQSDWQKRWQTLRKRRPSG